jgi:soluble lytic murein transglycosylase-like protein
MVPAGSLNARRDGPLILLAFAGVGLAVTVADHLSTPFDAIFDAAASLRGVDSNLLRALARVESGMRASAKSPPNANGTRDYGLMQINEKTAHGYGVEDPTQLISNPAAGVDVAARLLADYRKRLGERYSVHALISSYNQGVNGFLARGIWNETYVARVSFHHTLYSLGRALA